MSGEFGSYNNGYFHAQIEYAAADLANGDLEITRLWAKFFKAFEPVAYAIAWAEAGDCGPEAGILVTIKHMPEMKRSLKEIDDAMQVLLECHGSSSEKGNGKMTNSATKKTSDDAKWVTYVDYKGDLSKSSANPYEAINRPTHYDLLGIPGKQIIDVTMHLPHCRAAAIEYIFRAGGKPGVPAETDIRKAIKMLEYELERLEKIRPQETPSAETPRVAICQKCLDASKNAKPRIELGKGGHFCPYLCDECFTETFGLEQQP